MFENKTVVIGIGGGIAAYKTAYLAIFTQKFRKGKFVNGNTVNTAQFIDAVTISQIKNFTIIFAIQDAIHIRHHSKFTDISCDLSLKAF